MIHYTCIVNRPAGRFWLNHFIALLIALKMMNLAK